MSFSLSEYNSKYRERSHLDCGYGLLDAKF